MDRTIAPTRPIAALVLWVSLWLPLSAPGQDEATSVPELPAPTRLAADWWDYLGAAGKDLESRARKLADSLEALEATNESETILVREVRALLYTYPSLHGRPAPTTTTPLVAADRYSMVELLDLAARRRELRVEAAIETEEVTRDENVQRSARSRVSDSKAAYLDLARADPLRRERGLELMRTTLALAVAEDDLRLRRARAGALARAAAQLEAVLAAARARVAATPEDLKRFQSLRSTAQAELERLRRERDRSRLGQREYGDAPADRARRRHASQALLLDEARVAEAELRSERARLGIALVEDLLVPADPQALREIRSEGQRFLTAQAEQREAWSRASRRERTAASAQLALVADGDRALADLHRTRMDTAERTIESLGKADELAARTDTLLGILADRVVARGGRVGDLWASTVAAALSVWVGTVELASASMFEINQTPVTLLGVIRVIVILGVAWWLSKLVRGGLERVMARRETMSRASIYALQRVFHYVILAVGILVGLSSIGIDFTKFALLVSALGVGLGFGLQAIFSNFVAGLIILFEKSLKVGDFVELESGVNGEVREINIRGTLITTNDNIDILVPNSEFVNGRVTNWTLREAERRLRVPFGVAYGTDKELVRKAGLEAAEEVDFTQKANPARRPQVWLVRFGDSSLDFELVVWLTPDAVKRPGAVQAAYTWALESALGRHGIEIPFPQRDLHLRSAFGHKDAGGAEWTGRLRGGT